MRRLLALILCLVLCISLVPAAAAEDIDDIVIIEEKAPAEDEIIIDEPDAESQETIASGSCGDKVTWSLDSSGTLTLSGSGATWNFNSDYAGFYDYRDQIKSIVVESGITILGTNLFDHMTAAGSVTLPDTLTKIYGYVFSYCGKLTSVTIPKNVSSIGNYAFNRCTSLTEIRFKGHAPSFGSNVFWDDTATAYYYPLYDWTSSVRQSYGGTITWSCDDKVGYGVTWNLNDNNSLTLSGTGATWDFKNDYPGFYYFRDECQFIYVKDGVTALGSHLFWYMRPNGGRLFFSLAKTLTKIGDYAFAFCGTMSADFYRSAPSFGSNVFYQSDIVVASYPANDTSWTSIVSSAQGAKNMLWAENYVGDNLWLYSLVAKTENTAEFRAVNRQSQKMAVAQKNGSSYTRIASRYTGTADEYGLYDISLSSTVIHLAIALKGDANLDKRVNLRDAQTIKNHVADDLNPPLSAFACVAADVNGDGRLNLRDAQFLKNVIAGDETISW